MQLSKKRKSLVLCITCGVICAFVVLDTNYVIANFNSKFLEFGGEKKI